MLICSHCKSSLLVVHYLVFTAFDKVKAKWCHVSPSFMGPSIAAAQHSESGSCIPCLKCSVFCIIAWPHCRSLVWSLKSIELRSIHFLWFLFYFWIMEMFILLLSIEMFFFLFSSFTFLLTLLWFWVQSITQWVMTALPWA